MAPSFDANDSGTEPCANLIRGFNRNQEALVEILDRENFDAIYFNQLILKRDQILEEILNSPISEAQLRSIHTQHQFLENKLLKTHGQLAAQLKQMDAGKKAQKAYR